MCQIDALCAPLALLLRDPSGAMTSFISHANAIRLPLYKGKLRFGKTERRPKQSIGLRVHESFSGLQRMIYAPCPRLTILKGLQWVSGPFCATSPFQQRYLIKVLSCIPDKNFKDWYDWLE